MQLMHEAIRDWLSARHNASSEAPRGFVSLRVLKQPNFPCYFARIPCYRKNNSLLLK
jgi:hypothetical protein